MKIHSAMMIVALLASLPAIAGKNSPEATQSPRAYGSFNVDMSAEIVWNEQGGLSVRGATNLPDGTQLSVGGGNRWVGFDFGSFVSVSQGTFFSDLRFPNPNKVTIQAGAYRIDIVMVLAQKQPESVRLIIGNIGEYLSGTSAEDLGPGLGNVIMYETTVEVGPRP